MRKEKMKRKEKITEDTIHSLLMGCMLIYGVMIIVYAIYLILCIFKAI